MKAALWDLACALFSLLTTILLVVLLFVAMWRENWPYATFVLVLILFREVMRRER